MKPQKKNKVDIITLSIIGILIWIAISIAFAFIEQQMEISILKERKQTLETQMKNEEKELWDTVQERIEKLTDDEIDTLVYHKWFGKAVNDIVELMHVSVKSELSILQKLEERYFDTLDGIDEQIEKLLGDFAQ